MTSPLSDPNFVEVLRLFSKEFIPLCIEKGGPFPEGELHAIFSYGTLVRLNLNQTSSWEYDPQTDVKSSRYPNHRFTSQSSLEEIVHGNLAQFRTTLKNHPDQEQQIRRAYELLIRAGYPHPGGQSADTITHPILETKDEKNLWLTVFPWLSDDPLFTLSYTDSQQKADIAGREQRRLDYMSPHLIALIDGIGKITYLGY